VRANASLRSLSVRPESRSSQRGSVRTRNASCTPALVHARARRAFAPQSQIPGEAICLFLPFRMPCRARQSRLFAGELDGERRTRTADTTISVVGRNLSNSGGIPANKPVSAGDGGRWISASCDCLSLVWALRRVPVPNQNGSASAGGPATAGRTRVNQTATAARRSRMRRWRAGFSTSAARIWADSRALPSPRSARSR
jgi:hypothetical protein